MPYPPDCRINRYIMECKCHKMNFYTACILELIDTLWNVNQNLGFLEISTVPELIDTLWNVNQPGKRDGVKWGRINRYIMECKYPI